MALLNKVMLIGNATRDVELKYTGAGTAIASFGLAVNNNYKKGDEWVEDPCFLDVTVFGKSAETIGDKITKGTMTLVEGRLRQERWESDGQKRSKIVVIADRCSAIKRDTDKTDTEKPDGDRNTGKQQEDCPW